jgi:hypothetical protein
MRLLIAGMNRCALALLFAGCVHFPSYRELVSAPQTPPARVLIKDVRVFAGTSPRADEHQDVVLILVRGNPLEDISVTSSIAQVFLNGVPVDRHAP